MPSRSRWNVKNCSLPPDWPPASIHGMKRSREHASALTGAGLKGLLGGLIDAARRDVSRLAIRESVATHQLRVRMKKILALLRLSQDALSGQTFEAMRMHLRAVKNACAGQRERVVRDKLVARLADRFQISLPRPSNKAVRAAEPPSASYLSHQLCALEQLLDTSRIEALTPEQIVAAHAITYRKGRRMMKQAFEGASNADLKSEKLSDTMSFMFETRFPQHLTPFAAQAGHLQEDYIDCWGSLEKKFDGTPGVK